MKRAKYYEYIEEKLSTLSARISRRGKLNLLDLNIHSENFYADLFNLIFDFKLRNLNEIRQNVEGIDLVDDDNKVLVQVSATNTKEKLEASLKKEIMKKYKDYRFIFAPLTGDSSNIRNKAISNPHGVVFDPKNDIYDVSEILRKILHMTIDKHNELYSFIKDELGEEIRQEKVDTNLATIIDILSKENLTIPSKPYEVNDYEIKRKIDFNRLQGAEQTIELYKVYYGKLDDIYQEFDKLGSNKSLSVFAALANLYIRKTNKEKNEISVFYAIIESVIEIIQESKNYVEIPYEELEMCVSIIVVDAFIRCKIFKNPVGYNYVITG